MQVCDLKVVSTVLHIEHIDVLCVYLQVITKNGPLYNVLNSISQNNTLYTMLN